MMGPLQDMFPAIALSHADPRPTLETSSCMSATSRARSNRDFQRRRSQNCANELDYGALTLISPVEGVS